MRKKFLTLSVLAALGLAIGGCALPALQDWNSSESGGEIQSQQAGQGKNLDDLFAQVAAKAPGFGGMYVDGDNLNVYLKNINQAGAAQQAIADVFGAGVIPGAGIQALQGQYGFGQLRGWLNKLYALFGIEGVISLDIDETTNRLKVGVANSSAAGAVDQELSNLGVPSEAVIVVETEAILPMVTLRDRVRPLVGGLQINFPGYLCTYGFNATRSGVPGFVTNSHCTTTQGGVEGTQYWQPLSSVADSFVGTESVDPTYTKSKCPRSIRGKVCRNSDSAFVSHASGVSATLGEVAQTDGVNTTSLNIAGGFRIVGESPALVGQVVNKVGRTTGWSQGAVSATCVNTGVSGSNIVQLCQDHVNAAVGGGDSGSPVFRITNSPQSGDVLHYGILWGGNSGGTLFVYSPISNVQMSIELGTLTNCASGFSC